MALFSAHLGDVKGQRYNLSTHSAKAKIDQQKSLN